MSKINIHGLKDNSNDPTYRYKMDRFILKIEGSKTILTNISKVASDLGRSEKALLNYFGKSFGCSTNYDSKSNKATISKVLTLNDIEPKLFAYIETFILCDTCGNPETKLEEKKKGIFKICSACGKSNLIK
jgi:translation initiation factor 2 beta subunit (eIF-2beta)/eIF-5